MMVAGDLRSTGEVMAVFGGESIYKHVHMHNAETLKGLGLNSCRLKSLIGFHFHVKFHCFKTEWWLIKF